MSERAEQSFLILDRGVSVLLPPDATRKVATAAMRGEPLPLEESLRLEVLSKNPILKKRFPDVAIGVKYMSRVDMVWRERLYQLAEEISDQIAGEAVHLGQEGIVVLLFGSVARGLSRSKGDADPSNIDMAVVGNFSEEERLKLYDHIRPFREESREEIGSNLGVSIQSWRKLRNGNYGAAIEYIGAAARVLYDPCGLWQEFENEVFEFMCRHRTKKLTLPLIRGVCRLNGGRLGDKLYTALQAHFTNRVLLKEPISAAKE